MNATETNLPIATVHGLYHIAIKTDDLAATRKFYVDIVRLREVLNARN
jgi:catechol 2,3-dioxygenase-like lactoylglutathione lyase family enzyme